MADAQSMVKFCCIVGLIMVQIMVSSDARLKQVFNRHGGTRLLMAMSQFTKGEIKQEVTKTLKTVTFGRYICPKTGIRNFGVF